MNAALGFVAVEITAFRPTTVSRAYRPITWCVESVLGGLVRNIETFYGGHVCYMHVCVRVYSHMTADLQ